jgi:hypothetical protein
LEKAAEHGAQHGVKIKKMWDSADGYHSTCAVASGKAGQHHSKRKADAGTRYQRSQYVEVAI